LLTFGTAPEAWAPALVAAHGRGLVGNLELRTIDGAPARTDAAAAALLGAGFAAGYKGLTLRR
jgi:hypothetical protein